MKQYYFLFFFCLTFCAGKNVSAQTINNEIQSFLESRREELGLTTQDIQGWIVTDEYRSENLNLNHIYIRQTHAGIEVYNAVANFNLKNSEVISMGNRLESNIASRVNSIVPKITQIEAVSFAAEQLGLNLKDKPLLEEKVNEYKSIFSASSISLEKIPVKLMFQPSEDGKISLVWDLSIYQLDKKHWWSLRVDAETGKILDKVDWVVECNFGTCSHDWHKTTRRPIPDFSSEDFLPPPPSTDQYRVFPLPLESPNHGPRSLVVGPSNPTASPFGWHDTNGVAGAEYTTTRGNNVNAMEDADGNNGTGYAPSGTASLNFDFPLNMNQAAVNYRDAAITNLFYMNNIMHDIWYQYGFNDASGNFQDNNYGRGGTGNDGVIADAQDGSGTNNANFATPAEGTRPRMQMYLWTNTLQYLLTVNSPAGFAGQYVATEAGFGPPVPATPITANLALMTDATVDFYDGCNALTNAAAISGKIAVVRRGTCNFVTKVQAAQDAGAVAVIVVNNAAGSPIAMGGTSTTINIPSIMISQADGDPMINALLAGTTVNATLQNSGGPFDLDGDFDNGIVAHEYGHGISTRLTGGPANSNCLDNDEQMGEGWSDWFGLMLTIEPADVASDARGIGTFAVGEPTTGPGIRPAPYSTSFAVNNYTYGSVANTAVSLPHGIGFVWCTMLWDITWDLIAQYGYDSNLYTGTGGNNIAMNLVIAALKLQPCSPGFVDGRNAILEADSILYNGANNCLLWRAFARRGLGFSASQGSSASRSDQTEAFDLPSNCQAPTAAPDARFSAFPTCSGLVTFRDSSTINPTSWIWTFGDGSTSTLQNPTHTYTVSGTYSVKLVAVNSIGRDSVTISVVVNLPASPSASNVRVCQSQTASLSATGSGTITWFDSTGTVQLATGATFTTPALNTTTSYMVQSVVPAASQFVGPATTAIGSSANHNQPTIFTLNFTTYQPVTIVSVWVNASTTGNRTINVYNGPNGTGTVLTSATVNITATGQQRINLNLNIPNAGSYSIGGVSMNMFRNNAGVVFPYTLAAVLDITGSSAGTGFYYYFYNWEVRTASCVSAKVPVVANVNVLNNNLTSTNQICTALNGSANVVPTGGSSPYTFAWSNGRTTATLTGIAAGTYTVTTTDNIGCRRTNSVTITNSTTTLTSTSSTQGVGCTALGSATVSTTNGTAPYSFAWSNGGNSPSVSNLSAGTYRVTISDANGCAGTNSITITNNVVTVNSNVTSQPVGCLALGSATATATNGLSPYTYQWSNGANTSSVNNLNSGNYQVTVTDASGCTSTNSVSIANNIITLNSNTTLQNVNCSVLGSAAVSATNGSAPYTYQWSNGANASSINNLTAGSYQVTVTDANGCQGTNAVTIANNGTVINSNVSSQDANCAVLGSATATATSGQAPYSYLWSNGGNTESINNLAAGSYQVTVTDANGCQGTNAVSIANNGTVINSTVSFQDANCSVFGSATANVLNGQAPYAYLWSNGGNAATVNNLNAGNYQVSITDANGCQGTNTVSIANNGTVINSNVSSQDANCAVLGSATATATSGQTPYSYLWSNGENTSSINNLAAGSYQVTVTDANGCQGTNAITIANNGTVINSTVSSQDANCSVLGSAIANVSSGQSPFVYLWSNGGNAATVNNLNAGNYQLTITDANGCVGFNNVTVNLIPDPTVSLTQNNLSCFGLSDGTVSSVISGGTGAYTYLWSNGSTDASQSNLNAGTYSLTVTDANNCQGVSSVIITEPVAISLSSSSIGASVAGAQDGSLDLTVFGGQAPYQFSWSNSANTEDISALIAGNYSVTVIDNNGCITVETFNVADGPTAVVQFSLNDAIRLYPNPAENYSTLEISLSKIQNIEIKMIDALGRVLQNLNLSEVNSVIQEIDTQNYSAGVYMLTIQTENEIITKKLVINRK